MMINHQAVPQSLLKLGKGAATGRTFGITYIDQTSLYISSDKDILLQIQAVTAFFKNNRKPAFYHSEAFHRHTRAFFDDLHVRHLRSYQEKFPSFALFIDTKITQVGIVYHLIISLLSSTTRPFKYNARDNSSKCKK